jgi:sulfite exporter TauE/SafE
MTPNKIASLALKIVGIYSIIQSFDLIRALIHAIGFSFAEPPIRSTMILGASISLALLLILGIILIAFSRWIAGKLYSENAVYGHTQLPDTKNLQSIAFSIVGVVLMAVAIPKIFQISVNIYAFQKPGIEMQIAEKISKETLAFGIATSIQFIIGFLLFLGGSFLSNLWHKFINRIKYEQNITSRRS